MKYPKILFLAILALFILDWNEVLEIKHEALKDFLYLSILPLPGCLLIFEILFSEKKHLRWISFWIFILLLAWSNFKNLIYDTRPWESENVKLENRTWTNHRIEYQTKAFDCLVGERTVEVFHISKFFMIISFKRY